MATKFTPLHDRILVRRTEEEGTTRGGIHYSRFRLKISRRREK